MLAASVIPIAAAVAVAVTIPGPNVLAVTTTAMRDTRAGIRMALGVSTGDMIWAASAIAGLGAVLAHARPVFEVLRWLGAAYLVWFALRLWRGAGDASPTTTMPSRHAFARGLLVDLANPKAAIFFTTLFASLLPRELSAGLAVTVLAVVASIVFGWYVLLAVVFSRPGIQSRYRRAGRMINRVAAGAIGALGVRLAIDA